jgi:hypothetical protein
LADFELVAEDEGGIGSFIRGRLKMALKKNSADGGEGRGAHASCEVAIAGEQFERRTSALFPIFFIFLTTRPKIAGYGVTHMIRKGQAWGEAAATRVDRLHRFMVGKLLRGLMKEQYKQQ